MEFLPTIVKMIYETSKNMQGRNITEINPFEFLAAMGVMDLDACPLCNSTGCDGNSTIDMLWAVNDAIKSLAIDR